VPATCRIADLAYCRIGSFGDILASMRALIQMNASGRLTVPATVRRSAGLEGEAQFEVDVAADGSIVLRPAVVLAREDAWAYTTAHRGLLERAHADSRAGRVRELTEDELSRLAER
jgi:bifunctional DNA-binding transcriptional regulator/antitoxin component of YhaV-PrlF toxin-antitoxin module